MRIASLGSGSRGNATLLAARDCLLLVDCGFSLRDAQRRAAALGVDLADLTAILVTHEHSDHSGGVAALSRRYDLPVYLSHGTLSSGRLDGCVAYRPFNAGCRLEFGAITAEAVAVPHDAREPVQYLFSGAGRRVGVLTDLGSVTTHVTEAFRGCDVLLLEFNHDPRMLAEGPYPPALKRRVRGDWGHLSNGQAIDFLERVGVEGLQRLFIAHTSEKNNSRERVEAALRERMPHLLPRIAWARQDGGFPWFEAEAAEHRDADTLASVAGVGAY